MIVYRKAWHEQLSGSQTSLSDTNIRKYYIPITIKMKATEPPPPLFIQLKYSFLIDKLPMLIGHSDVLEEEFGNLLG